MEASPTKTYARFSLLPTIMKCRQMYGLRNDDYKRYRQFCSRRLARLRVTYGFCQRKGKEYKKKKLTFETLTDINQLWIMVFTIERYWSYSMELENQSRLFANPQCNPKRRHQLSKNRAMLLTLLRFSKLLSTIMESTGNISLHPVDALDLRAYIHFMKGYIRFERHLWDDALADFIDAKSMYEKLMQLDTDDHSREAYLPMMLESLNPYFRCCTYHLAKEGLSVDALAQWISTSQQQSAMETDFDQLAITTTWLTSFDLHFLNTTATLQQRSVIGHLSQLESFLQTLPLLHTVQEKMHAYQAMIATLFGLEQRATKLQEPLLLAYTQYMKHMVPIHRTHALLTPIDPIIPITVSQIRLAQDQVHYHDTILQHLEQLHHPSLLSSPGLQSTLTNTLLFFKAWKAWTLGMHAAKHHQWTQSMQRFQEALHHLQQHVMLIPFHPQSALPFPDITLTPLMCEGRMVWLRAQSHLPVPEPVPMALAPTSHRCTRFFQRGVFLPIPAKPILFDLAHEFIQPAPLGLATTTLRGNKKKPRIPAKKEKKNNVSAQTKNEASRDPPASTSSGLFGWIRSFGT